MEKFLEQLENLKATFRQLPEDCVIEAIERMDQTVEQLSQSVVFVEAQEDFLADMGKDVVQDFFNNPFSPTPPTSAAVDDFYPDPLPTADFFASDFSDSNEPTPSTLFCFTCGEGFNNRKGLYRHGNATGHQTRQFKYNKKKKVEDFEVFPSASVEIPCSSNTTFPVDFLEPEPQRSEAQKPLKTLLDPNDISLESITEESEISDEKLDEKLICYECNTSFKNRKALWRHGQRTKHQLRLKRAIVFKGGHVQCPECIYSTEKISNLRIHFRRNHKNCM
ncbi:hypothetical protein CAEBREN_29726 [Caenorhabditis brenneri]|uniref:C2H2-type domain-containing protein n=1 Tax=Caenorhabditis brenneri TaxID=135651 RepID=G0N378_CAEBE|nr:hypothetical protein CAEBREN_29726 [Caenorhabditis brenneri]